MSKPARPAGVLLCALGAALLAFAVTWGLLAPRSASTLPLDYESQSVAQGSGTLLDPASLDSEQLRIDSDVPLTRVQQVLSVEPGDSDVMTAQIGTTLSRDDREGEEALAGATVQRVSVDRHSALAVDDAANSSLQTTAGEPSTPIKAEGLTFSWPRGAERRDYPFFDVDASQSAAMEYLDDGDVEGTPVHIYTQELVDVDKVADDPSQVVSVEPVALPESAPARLRDSEDTLRLHTFYSVTRTAFVEPRSGRVLRTEEDVHEYLGQRAGEVAATVREYTLDTSPESTRQAIEAAREVTGSTRLAETTIPWVAGIAGGAVLLIGVGVQILRNRRI